MNKMRYMYIATFQKCKWYSYLGLLFFYKHPSTKRLTPQVTYKYVFDQWYNYFSMELYSIFLNLPMIQCFVFLHKLFQIFSFKELYTCLAVSAYMLRKWPLPNIFLLWKCTWEDCVFLQPSPLSQTCFIGFNILWEVS